MFDKNDLLELTRMRMPFGKYEGRILMDIPEDYLLWLNKKGLPAGRLGLLLGLLLEIKINGLENLLTPLRQGQMLPVHPAHPNLQ
ncbi:MAG: hypothetical protein RL217_674 [Pseudomonadota bacterium]